MEESGERFGVKEKIVDIHGEDAVLVIVGLQGKRNSKSTRSRGFMKDFCNYIQFSVPRLLAT